MSKYDVIVVIARPGGAAAPPGPKGEEGSMRAWQAKILIVWSSLVMGLSLVLTRLGLEGASPAVFVLCRFAISLLVAIAIFNRRLLGIPRPALLHGLAMGLLLGLGCLLQAYSVRFTLIQRVAFLSALAIPCVPILQFAFFRRDPDFFRLAGGVLAANGIFFLLNPNFTGLMPGDILAIATVPVFSLYLVLAARHAFKNKHCPNFVPRLITTHLAGAIPVALVAALALEGFVFPAPTPLLEGGLSPSPGLFWGLGFCALLATVFLALALAAGLRHSSCRFVVISSQAAPILATLAAVLFLAEPMGLKEGVGAFLIILGLAGPEIVQNDSSWPER
jgi:drug/metabolite transporter (DMT)-like permease